MDPVTILLALGSGLISGSMVKIADYMIAKKTATHELQRRIREKLYPTLLAVSESLRRNVLAKEKQIQINRHEREMKETFKRLLIAHRKWFEELIYKRGIVAYLKDQYMKYVFDVYSDIVVAITRLDLDLDPYIVNRGDMEHNLEELITYCKDKLEIKEEADIWTS